MNNLLANIPQDEDKAATVFQRKAIVAIEDSIKAGEFGKPVLRKDTLEWSKHYLSDGVYLREINIPAGMVLTGKIHKQAHLNILSKGRVSIVDGYGKAVTLTAPYTWESKAGIKRVLVTHTDITFTTIHHNPNNETDLDKLEDMYTCDEFKQLGVEENAIVEQVQEKVA